MILEIQKLAREIQQVLKENEATACAEKKTTARNHYITKLTDYLHTYTDDFINKKTDEKRTELMVKLEDELVTYKNGLYKERNNVRQYIATIPTAVNRCYHTQPFKFNPDYDPYSGRHNPHEYSVYCTQCNNCLGTCQADWKQKHMYSIKFYDNITNIMFPLSELKYNIQNDIQSD